MARAPAFRIQAVAELLRQLEYAPPETRKRHMDAAERLVGELDPRQAYPSEFVIYRITGYRPDDPDMVTFAGEALRMDLCNLVQRLSDTLSLPPMRNARTAHELADVARMLGVSSKSVQRYRREGLVCHVVNLADDRRRLACYADAIERFALERQARLSQAAKFTRIDADGERAIIEQAWRLRRERRLSLNAAARIISRSHGRAHETIRQLLHRHERSTDEPIFARERAAIDPRAVSMMHRAWMRGVDLPAIAVRFARSKPAILRAINRRRSELLRSLSIRWIELPTFNRDGAEDVILSAATVGSDLLSLPKHDDAFALLDWAGSAAVVEPNVELSMLAGWNYLKRRAANAIAELPDAEAPTSETLDCAETDLRWASRLHRRLTLLAFPAALRRIELNLGRGLVTLPADTIVTMIVRALGVIRESLEGLDPARGQRLDRVVGFAMERELAQRSPLTGAGPKAAALHARGTLIPVRRAFDGIDEWEPWLEPWRHARSSVADIADRMLRELLVKRFGWDGHPPKTLAAMGQEIGQRQPTVARKMQEALRELRAAMRRQIA